MIYLQLFLSFIKIGSFGFGGGYVMLSMIHTEIVASRGWLTEGQLTDVIVVSQMVPGAIAVNSATYVGYIVTGNIWGAILAAVAVCLPSLVIMVLITRFFLKLKNSPYVKDAIWGMMPMLVAMIGVAAAMLFTPESFIDYVSWIFFGAALIATMMKLNPMLLIVFAGLAGWLVYGI